MLLAAGEPDDGHRIVDLAAYERERLQPGVVEVRGDAQALRLAAGRDD